MGGELERALLEQGIRCFPGFAETSTADTIRIFHAGTLAGRFVDMVLYPAEDTDRDLAEALTKFKGKWDWGATSDAPELETSMVAPAEHLEGAARAPH